MLIYHPRNVKIVKKYMILNMILVLGMVAHFCNPGTWDVEAGG